MEVDRKLWNSENEVLNERTKAEREIHTIHISQKTSSGNYLVASKEMGDKDCTNAECFRYCRLRGKILFLLSVYLAMPCGINLGCRVMTIL